MVRKSKYVPEITLTKKSLILRSDILNTEDPVKHDLKSRCICMVLVLNLAYHWRMLRFWTLNPSGLKVGRGGTITRVVPKARGL